MVEKKRKIKFYFLSMEKKADGKVLSKTDLENKFQEVVENIRCQAPLNFCLKGVRDR